MKSKRILFNESINKQIIEIDVECKDKISEILIDLIKTKKLTTDEILAISSTLYILSLVYFIQNDSEIYRIKFTLSNYPNIWQHISEIYNEAYLKIKDLEAKIQKPRKQLTIDNIETIEEYEKLKDRYLDKYLDGFITKEKFYLVIDKGKELGFVNNT